MSKEKTINPISLYKSNSVPRICLRAGISSPCKVYSYTRDKTPKYFRFTEVGFRICLKIK